MLKSQKMSRIAIIGTKGVLREVVEKLYELSMLHIVDFTEESEDFRIGKPQEIASKYSEYLLSIRAILSFVGEEVPKRKFKKMEILQRIEDVISSCSPRVDRIRSRKAEIERELSKIEGYLEFKEKVEVLGVSEDIFERYENLCCLFGISDGDPSHFIENPDIILKTGKLEKLYVNAIFSPLEFENELREILKQVNFAEIPIVEREERFSKPNERREELLSELLKIEGEILKLREKYSEFLMAANEYFSSEIEKAEAPLKFATSDSAFIAEGWIPEAEFERLSREVESISSGKAYVQKLKTIVTEETPIVLSNPKPVRPVELLTNTFSIPKYGEIDPSIVLYIAFPFFYGFMLGDVGYGLLLMVLGIALKKNYKNSFVRLSNLFTGRPDSEGLDKMLDIFVYYCCTISIIFGIIYGEFFGLEIFGEHSAFGLEEFQTPLHRLHQVPLMILITMTIGLIQMVLAYIFSIFNLSKEHGFKKAFEEKIGWIIVLVGVYYLFFTYALKFFPEIPVMQEKSIGPISIPLAIIFAFILFGVLIIVMVEGAMYVIEVFTLVSNLFSYTRLLAIGLSSAGIALAANIMIERAIGFGFSGKGFLLIITVLVMIILMILLVSLHAINLALGIIGPGIHSLRLQYVEFMPKFFEGGGTEYAPFGFLKKYVEKEG